MQYSIIDTFTDKIFHGNPAAVFHIDKFLDDKIMALIAKEINLTNVVFLQQNNENRFDYHCFSPNQKIIEPSHGLLAAAHYLRKYNNVKNSATLLSKNHEISVSWESKDNNITLHLPSCKSEPIKVPDRLAQALNKIPVVSVHQAGSDCLVELYHQDDILNLQPDFNRLKKLDFNGIIVTSEEDGNYDFVYRYFSTALSAANEDPVNIAALCQLVPFWYNRLNKNNFNILQMSQRQGKMSVKYDGSSIFLTSKTIESFSSNFLYQID